MRPQRSCIPNTRQADFKSFLKARNLRMNRTMQQSMGVHGNCAQARLQSSNHGLYKLRRLLDSAIHSIREVRSGNDELGVAHLCKISVGRQHKGGTSNRISSVAVHLRVSLVNICKLLSLQWVSKGHSSLAYQYKSPKAAQQHTYSHVILCVQVQQCASDLLSTLYHSQPIISNIEGIVCSTCEYPASTTLLLGQLVASCCAN